MPSNPNAPQIDAKSLTMLEDQMNNEALACHKCTQYAQFFSDPALKTFASDLAQHHRNHFNSMLDYLNSHR